MSEMIGRLRVALGLETAAFEKGAKRASAEIKTLGTATEKAALHVGSMTKAVVAGASAIAGLAVVDKLKDMVKSGLDYASSLGETAKQLGVTAKSLQEYRYVASQTGVEQADMDAALAKLTRRVGEAATGNKKAMEAFSSLGLSIRDSNGHVKDAGALIPEIAAKLEGLSSPAEKAARLVDLFGKSGQKLAPLMEEGARGINKMRDSAREMGIVLSDQMIANADDAADKMGTLNQVLSMQISSIVAANAKEIAAFTTTITNFAVETIKAINAWNRFNGAMDEREVAKQKLAERIDRRAKEQGMSPERKARAMEVGNQVLDKIYGVAPVSQGGGWYSNNPLFRLKTVTPKNNFAATSGPIGNGAIGMMAGMAPGRGAGLGERLSGSAAIAAMLGDESITVNIDQVNAKLTALQDRMGTMSIETERASIMVSQSFEEMAQNSIYALDRLASAVQGGGALNVLSAILGLGVQVAGMFPGKTNLPTASAINSKALASLQGSALATIPGYANGTNFHPGGLALVGERGPEILRLPRGSGVTPNHALGGVTHNYFNGNLMTPEFWAMIQNGDRAAAQIGAAAGAEGGFAKVVKANRRRIG